MYDGTAVPKTRNLDKAKDTANWAVGLFISVGKDLLSSERKSFLTDITIPLIERCLSDHVEPRVLKKLDYLDVLHPKSKLY